MKMFLGFIGVAFILGFLKEHPVLALVVGVILFFGGLHIFFKMDEAAEKERSLIQAADDAAQALIPQLIQTHIQKLALKYDQTVTRDDYGNYNFEKWNKEIDYFIDNVCMKDPTISAYILRNPDERINPLWKQIGAAVFAYKEQQIESGEGLATDAEALDPVAFEHYCKDLLIASGWEARTTKGSGDQGVDVIATMGAVKAVFQCKKYSKPVGNAAVQEIVAGKAHEQAHVAAVVTNNTYTPAAKQLANTTGVHLLHYSELPSFAAMIGLVEDTEPASQDEA